MSILKLLLGAMATTTTVLLLTKGYDGLVKLHLKLSEHKNAYSEVLRASNDIMKVGRTAQACVRLLPTPTTPEGLECRVDMNHPPTAATTDDTLFRFIVVQVGQDSALQWQKFNGQSFVPYVTYKKVLKFEICDFDRMADGTCPILPQLISTRYLANVGMTPTPFHRLFRFRLEGVSKYGSKKQIQSAFSMRHPSPEGVLYEWGVWNNE